MPIKDPEKKKEAQRRADAKRAGRAYNFATVVYPESAPEDWVDRLSDYHVAVLISPLHDKDVNPSGEPKKPHYHVMLMFETLKNYDLQVKPLIEAIGGVGREEVNSVRGYARYLCHLDNPEKAQYDVSGIRALGGADYEALIQLPSDDLRMLKGIFEYVRLNQVYSLAELLDICMINNPDWFGLIADRRAYIVDKYIKSLAWERDSGYVRKEDMQVDDATGEVLTKNE